VSGFACGPGSEHLKAIFHVGPGLLFQTLPSFSTITRSNNIQMEACNAHSALESIELPSLLVSFPSSTPAHSELASANAIDYVDHHNSNQNYNFYLSLLLSLSHIAKSISH
jgi:hypothetical protein